MSKITYTAADVARGFTGAATFSLEAAAAVASALNKAGDLGAMEPDDAARAVQAAVFAGTKGATVSIDGSLGALSAIHARRAAIAAAEPASEGAPAEPGNGRRLSGAAMAAAERKAAKADAPAGNG